MARAPQRRYDRDPHDDERIYCISILENFSRAAVASAISRRQDLTAVVLVLYAAVRQHGVSVRGGESSTLSVGVLHPRP